MPEITVTTPSSLERLSVQLQGIARQIGAMSRARFDSPDFVDLLDASDAVWRAAVALDRVVRVSSSTGDQAGEGLAHYRRRGLGGLTVVPQLSARLMTEVNHMEVAGADRS